MTTNVFSFTTKMHNLWLKGGGVTPQPHIPASPPDAATPSGFPRLPASGAAHARSPSSAHVARSGPSPFKHGGAQGLKPHVRESGRLGLCSVSQFPFPTLGCIPSTLPQPLAGCCVSATMKTKPVSHKTENTHRVSEGAWARRRESLVFSDVGLALSRTPGAAESWAKRQSLAPRL